MANSNKYNSLQRGRDTEHENTKCDTQHNNTQYLVPVCLSFVFLRYAKCCYAECVKVRVVLLFNTSWYLAALVKNFIMEAPVWDEVL